MNRNSIPNYDKNPFVHVNGYDNESWQGMTAIAEVIKSKIADQQTKKIVVVLDMYHGVYEAELIDLLTGLVPFDHVFDVSRANHSEDHVLQMLENNLTDDRVFGVMSHHRTEHFFDPSKTAYMRDEICNLDSGIILVHGIAASYIANGDILIYADMARWEIQLRMRRKEITNWCSNDFDIDYMKKYKRAFFIDWRVLDVHKQQLFDQIDFLLDSNDASSYKMISGDAFRAGLQQASAQPVRLVPFFDPGPWGGQWMKEVCNLNPDKENYAWCFDCVPEENSLQLKVGNVGIEIPSINLVFRHPKELLGSKVHARFGKEFPIRFDFLDTMEGGNLSLQVHPLTEYIQNTFGMHYTQDESYYILDAKEDATVYLGIKDDTDPDEMLSALNDAQSGDLPFDADRYINKFPAKKHDHFLIPAGTVHCSGKNAMVLEISATPYIFTFKLWDWGRLGLDGRPRPIHLDHGKEVIQWDRRTEWVTKNLVSPVETITESDEHIEERTGLHELEFIETRRHWSDQTVLHDTEGGVNVLNLVEGDEAIVESPSNAFKPFVVHYAETFIIPAAVGQYTIRPHGRSKGKKIATLKAYVRT